MLPEYNWEELRSQPHWSYSSLNQILNICSQQYAFRKVEKLEAETVSIALLFGTAYHRALSYFYSALNEEVLPATELVSYFSAVLKTAVKHEERHVKFPEGKPLDYFCDLGQKMISTALEQRDPDDKVVGTDIALKVDLPGTKPLICELDLLVENKGRLIIVDHKTSASRWPEGKCHSDLQATAYLYTFRQQVQEDILFRYDVCTKAKSPTLTRLYTDRTEKDFRRFLQLVKTADRIAESKLWYPSESFFCKGCAYGEACSNWAVAA